MKWLLVSAASLTILAAPLVHAESESPCGSLANAYGPLDYRKERGKGLAIVDRAHFNDDVRNFRKGQSATLGGDLDYVLRASPNHHQALYTISEWGVKLKTHQPPTMGRSIDCYFERAIRFQPDDYIVRLLYGSFLQRMEQKDEAMKLLAPMEAMEELGPFTHHNLGLLFLDLNEPERALRQAWKAEEQGWTRPDLKNRLQAEGKWREKDAASAPDAAASSPVTSASAPARQP